MATQKTTKPKTKIKQQEQRFGDSMADEVILIIIVVVCIILLISLLTKRMGILGAVLSDGLKGTLGISSILLPLSMIAYCSWLLGSEEKKNREVRIGGIALLLLSVSALAHVFHPIEVSIMSNLGETLQSYYREGAFNNGGLFGGILGGGVMRVLGKIGSCIIWIAVFLISIIMTTGKSLFKGVSNVNTYQKNKRKQYHEKRQQMEVAREQVTYLQEVPKKPVKPKPQPRQEMQPKPQPKLQQKQAIKKKKQKKSDFNILLRADEGYNHNKEETPIIEATIFKPKTEETIALEPAPKIPIIFDYGRTESEILAEQQEVNQMPLEEIPEQTVLPESPSQIDIEAQRQQKREERRKRRLEREKELRERELRERERKRQEQIQQQKEKQQEQQNDIVKEEEEKTETEQTVTEIQPQTEQNEVSTNSIRYMIFKEGEEEPLLEEQEQQTQQQETEQVEQVKSDTEDIADVLELLNRIQFEEEESEKIEENAQEQQSETDIMEIIENWAEEEQDIPQSNGLTLFLAEEESPQQTEEIEEETEQSQHIVEETTEKISQEVEQQLNEETPLRHSDMTVKKMEETQQQIEQEIEEIQQQQEINQKTEETQQEINEKAEEMQQREEQRQEQQHMEEEIEEIEQQQNEIEEIVKQEPPYLFPPLDLLNKKQAVQSSESKSEMLANAKKLENTLKSFGVEAKVIQINKGPTVTRYELSPKQGVKVSKIVNLSDDIALNLAASDIRMEAPIPGKAAVGIEIPNKEIQSVSLRSVLESETFQKFPSKLAFALGEDITGQPIVTDIAKMPHLLIAGATGSGKSVCINTLITSILYKAKPEEVKLLLVDPKVVELSVYNGIPHLLIPVVTDPKKASAALNWAVREMLARYQDFAENGVRDIKGYNAMKKEKGETDGLMPQIVIIIDELADLMMAAPGEVEDAICRLAQLARAAGMHLIIATQRPSVDIITGVIKANIPSRLAFAVSSGIDSRTILDMTGAEKLLGKGDMLFYPQGMSKPVRIQGAFLSDKEVENIVHFVKKDRNTDYDKEMIEQITSTAKMEADSENTDEFFDSAVELVIQKEKASTSMLQRQFHIGYNRAARLMESLEEQGIVGSEEGSKPRKVLITKQQWEDRKREIPKGQ